MKTRLLYAIAALALITTPALAMSTTVEFAGSNGTTTTVVFNSDGTASINGAAPGPYTIDQAAKKICGDAQRRQLCHGDHHGRHAVGGCGRQSAAATFVSDGPRLRGDHRNSGIRRPEHRLTQ